MKQCFLQDASIGTVGVSQRGTMIQDDRSSDSRRVIDGVGSQMAQSEVVDGIRRLKLTWRRGHQSNVRWLPDR